MCLQVQERLKLFRRNSEGAAASLAYQYQNCTREQVNSVCEERGGRRGGREGREGGKGERGERGEEERGRRVREERKEGRREGGREAVPSLSCTLCVYTTFLSSCGPAIEWSGTETHPPPHLPFTPPPACVLYSSPLPPPQVCEAVRLLELDRSRLKAYIDQLLAVVLEKIPSLLEGMPRIQQGGGMRLELLTMATLPEVGHLTPRSILIGQ